MSATGYALLKSCDNDWFMHHVFLVWLWAPQEQIVKSPSTGLIRIITLEDIQRYVCEGASSGNLCLWLVHNICFDQKIVEEWQGAGMPETRRVSVAMNVYEYLAAVWISKWVAISDITFIQREVAALSPSRIKREQRTTLDRWVNGHHGESLRVGRDSCRGALELFFGGATCLFSYKTERNVEIWFSFPAVQSSEKNCQNMDFESLNFLHCVCLYRVIHYVFQHLCLSLRDTLAIVWQILLPAEQLCSAVKVSTQDQGVN